MSSMCHNPNVGFNSNYHFQQPQFGVFLTPLCILGAPNDSNFQMGVIFSFRGLNERFWCVTRLKLHLTLNTTFGTPHLGRFYPFLPLGAPQRLQISNEGYIFMQGPKWKILMCYKLKVIFNPKYYLSHPRFGVFLPLFAPWGALNDSKFLMMLI